ncbi:Putative transposase in snaA-snaB intergenic region [Luteimicrobium xylanilyticum]|uniref:Transposase in snaA-snaB intergenic region n=1 Tax=Luteimicrobium xylanilyticum TaxID=1133546 RepID=A0A5P9QB97_9MICO|nr:IS607 family element RNA-guided endonuclease TnpB [Luteimicrobium xylanilyticum]QFU97715.1 Putative transposase in snaA-snaB intergenic region [Luteimicrobium xylanilyticum]
MTLQGFRVELAPNPVQADRLAQHAGLHRVVFNHCLAHVKAVMGQRAAERTYGLAEGELTPAASWSAPELEKYWRRTHAQVYPWFTGEGLSSRVPKEACRALASALSNWAKSKAGARKGRRVGFPRFRRRKDGATCRFDARTAYPATARSVHVPTVGKVAVREDMGWLTDRIADGRARVLGSRFERRAGRWWLSFQVEVDRADLNTRRAVPTGAAVVGIDLGIKTFATVADGDGKVTKVANPRHLGRELRRLRRANKALARKRNGSANRAKAARTVARVHLDVAHARADFLHKLTTTLTRTNSVLVIEDLSVAGMVRNRRLARHIADAGWAEFRRQLEYKAKWYGSKVIVADRWYPSTRTCYACGHVHPGLTLADRTWTCPCGTAHDRDHTAALNLLRLAA